MIQRKRKCQSKLVELEEIKHRKRTNHYLTFLRTKKEKNKVTAVFQLQQQMQREPVESSFLFLLCWVKERFWNSITWIPCKNGGILLGTSWMTSQRRAGLSNSNKYRIIITLFTNSAKNTLVYANFVKYFFISTKVTCCIGLRRCSFFSMPRMQC